MLGLAKSARSDWRGKGIRPFLNISIACRTHAPRSTLGENQRSHAASSTGKCDWCRLELSWMRGCPQSRICVADIRISLSISNQSIQSQTSSTYLAPRLKRGPRLYNADRSSTEKHCWLRGSAVRHALLSKSTSKPYRMRGKIHRGNRATAISKRGDS